MKNLSKICLLVAVALIVATPASAEKTARGAGSIGIAAIVNDDVVTFSDINNRLALYTMGRAAPPADVRLDLEKKTLNRLIDEKLQMQEAKNLGISVTDEQLKGAFASIAEQNKATPEQFKTGLTQSGVNVDTLYDQVRAEIAWGMVARRKLRAQVNISEQEIDSELQRNPVAPAPVPAVAATEQPAPQTAQPVPGGQAKETLLHLKQIIISISADEPEAIINAKAKRAEMLQSEITSCAEMDARMKDFTGSLDMGRGPLSALPAPIRDAVANLPVGTLSVPVRGNDAIAVFMVCDRQETAPSPAPAAPEAPVASTSPTETPDEVAREAVANKLGMQRLQQLQERYLRDLRATAYIDRRI